MSNIREMIENNEEIILCPLAAKAKYSKGREVQETPCEIRTCYQRDRDRIIHCKAFRRLKHKTQVFLSPESDHYRTRLTHTLEVSQIARTIARALRLNEDLTEAIALGHDLGHTPFGHAGERALRKLLEGMGGFTHYDQSVRVCRLLEKDGKGLNLTKEVLNGIERHTNGEWASTLEGRIVRYADRIAYINHDIDDAVRGGIIKQSDIPRDIIEKLGDTKSKRINTLVTSVINNSKDDIVMDPDTYTYYDKLHEFLYSSVYLNPAAKSEESKVDGIIEGIFNNAVNNPDVIPAEYRHVLEREGIYRAAADYVAGMTDHFALTVYSNLYIPKSWSL